MGGPPCSPFSGSGRGPKPLGTMAVLNHEPMRFNKEERKRGVVGSRPARVMSTRDDFGKPQNSLEVSDGSPDFMRSAAARAALSARGAGSSPGLLTPRPSTPGFLTPGRAAGLHEYEQAPRSRKHRTAENGAVITVGFMSERSPEWMRRPVEKNRAYLEASGRVPPEKQPPPRSARQRNPLMMSKQMPEWIRAPYDNNGGYLEANGHPPFFTRAQGSAAGCVPERGEDRPLAAKGAKTPRAKKASSETVSWMKLHRSYDPSCATDGASTNTVTPAGTYPKPRGRGLRIDVEAISGRIISQGTVSSDSPGWMKESYSSNKAYFSDRGVMTHLSKEPPLREQALGKRPVRVGKKGQTLNMTMVSVQAPSWIIQQANDNAAQLRGWGHDSKQRASTLRYSPVPREFRPPQRRGAMRRTASADDIAAGTRPYRDPELCIVGGDSVAS